MVEWGPPHNSAAAAIKPIPRDGSDSAPVSSAPGGSKGAVTMPTAPSLMHEDNALKARSRAMEEGDMTTDMTWIAKPSDDMQLHDTPSVP